MMSTKIKAAIYDIDNTLTREDTFFLFLRYFVKMHPAKIFNLWLLPIAFILSRLKICDRVIVKKVVAKEFGRLGKIERDRLINDFINDLVKPIVLDKGLKSIDEHKKNGFYIILISASPSFYVEGIFKLLKADAFMSTSTEGDPLRVVSKHCYGSEKINRLKEFLEESELELDYEASFFYSDHHSDSPLMQVVGHPVATNGTTKLLSLANQKGWQTLNWKV